MSGVCPTTLMNQLLFLLPPGDHPETMFLLLFLDGLLHHGAYKLPADGPHFPPTAGHGCLWGPYLGQHTVSYPTGPCSPSPASTISMWLVSCSGCSRSPAAHCRPDYCNYHRRFGAAAHHCQAPCSWLGQQLGKGPATGGL